MITWVEDHRGDCTSPCGRYRLSFRSRIGCQGTQCLVYFYSFLAHRDSDCSLLQLKDRVGRWCVEHRAKALPRISAFEDWAAAHYRLDLRFCAGPISRRNMIKRAIGEADGWQRGLPIMRDIYTMTIGEAYRLLYENAEPEQG